MGTADGIGYFLVVYVSEALFVFFRLWHQLTLQVLDFVQDPCFAQGDGLIKVMTCHTRSDYVEYTQRLFFFILVCVGEGRGREST